MGTKVPRPRRPAEDEESAIEAALMEQATGGAGHPMERPEPRKPRRRRQRKPAKARGTR